jgi:hypothetical protein
VTAVISLPPIAEPVAIDPRSLPVRFTRLKAMGRSPIHYWQACQDADVDKPAYLFGRAVHSFVLGGEEVLCYRARRAGKAWEAFELEHRGAEILSVAEYDRARRTADAVLSDEHATSVINWGLHEVQVEWTNCGRACSSRIDVMGHDFIVDLKTTRNAQPEWFMREALKMNYHAQIAWYQDAANFKTKRQFPIGYIVSVESTPPYPVVVMKISERALEQGQRICRLWLERLLACESANEWPGYVQHIVELDIPDDTDETLIIEGEEVTM